MNKIDFMGLMELRKTVLSNTLLYMYANPREYKENVCNYLNLLNDLNLVDTYKKVANKTIINLKTGIKFILLLNKNIEKLYGYRYYDFRVFGYYD